MAFDSEEYAISPLTEKLFFVCFLGVTVTSSTVVSCSEMEDTRPAKLMELRTSSDIEIEILVPNENFVPLGVLRRAGNFVMQRVVDIGLPQVNQSPIIQSLNRSSA